MSYTDILNLLQCLQCGGDLSEKPNSELVCIKNNHHRYPIQDGIVRFVSSEIGGGYNIHWNTFDKNSISQIKLSHAEHFISWFLGQPNHAATKSKIFLDVGCGDGNHLSFLPEASVKIALDYSNIVNVVASRYKDIKNLFIIQGDARQLPFKTASIDYLTSYGCLNCLADPKQGLDEAVRVLKRDGLLAAWGYGTDNHLMRYGINISRKLYRFVDSALWRKSVVYSMIPGLLLVKNSTGIRPGQNSLTECAEIISTNLSPEHLYIFDNHTWQDLAPSDLEYIEDYDLFCGQKFRKR